jgi:hypothetical protein
MVDSRDVRAQVNAVRAQIDAALAELPALTATGAEAERRAKRATLDSLRRKEVQLSSQYRAIVGVGDQLTDLEPGMPIMLLPVRIETTFLPTPEVDLDSGEATVFAVTDPVDLVVRVYPDDIHVDAHEPELTEAELRAGGAYWRAVWGAGGNDARRQGAWQVLLGELSPGRAAWVVRALTPAADPPTDETPPHQQQPEPPLPAVPARADTWTRAARTALLPDNWRVVGLRAGQVVFRADGSPLRETLAVGPAPPAAGGQAEPADDGPFDEASRWLVDLEAAQRAGMALRITLSRADAQIDQLLVLGTSSAPPADSAALVGEALLAHQYGGGLGFLPPGTPTNNTEATRSAWQSHPEPRAPAEIDALRVKYAAGSNQNAALLAAAFGLDAAAAEVLAVAPHGLRDQQTAAGAVHRLTGWALAPEFFRMLQPLAISDQPRPWLVPVPFGAGRELVEHMGAWVRARGPLPVLRVGRQPYGVLPVSSLDAWVPAAGEVAGEAVARWTRALRPYFQAGLARVPRLTGLVDQDRALLDVLARLPVSTRWRRRELDWDSVQEGVATWRRFLGIAHPCALYYLNPSAAAVFTDGDIVGDVRRLREGMTVHGSLHDLLVDALDWIEGRASLEALHDRWQERVTTLLHSPEQIDQWQLGDGVFAALSGDAAKALGVDEFLWPIFMIVTQQVDAGSLGRLPTYDLASWLPVSEAVRDLDHDTLAGLTFESLDLVSHRLDAWVTSLATERLAALRAVRPGGVHLGAYGWVEDLRPMTPPIPLSEVPVPGYEPLLAAPGDGYLHAPSLHHAATAAVLRSGYRSHSDPAAFAVDLSSRRARVAQWVLSGVRAGQPIGALLGYRFERGLHEAELDALIDDVRREWPLPVGTERRPDRGGDAALEAVARNVVDGLELYRHRDSVLGKLPEWEPVPPNASEKLTTLLEDLAGTVDALGDLLLAEGVHHLVGGNPLQAGLVVDALGRGETLPDRYEVLRTPHSGRALACMVGVLLPAAGPRTPASWQADRPRAVAAPQLEAWAGRLLGDPARWRVRCEAPGLEGGAQVGLDELGLCALDVVAESAADASGQPLLVRRLAEHLGDRLRPGAELALVGHELLWAMCARLRRSLAAAVPLTPRHLGQESEAGDEVDLDELADRAGRFLAGFAEAAAALETALADLGTAATGPQRRAAAAAVRTALLRLADHGRQGAYPLPVGPDDAPDAAVAALAAHGHAVAAGLATLARAVPARVVPADDGQAAPAAVDPRRWVAQVTSALRDVLGDGIPVLPAFRLGQAGAAAFGPGSAPDGADPAAALAWLGGVARVRPAVGALQDLLLAGEVAGHGGNGALRVIQTPHTPGARWAARAGGGAGEGAAPAARATAVLQLPLPVDPAAGLCGIVVDEWTEVLPGLSMLDGVEPAEITGVAMRYDQPDARPPQAVLLAVPPDLGKGWTFEALLSIVRETLELAKLRAVDLGDVPRLGRVLPIGYGAGQYTFDDGGRLNRLLKRLRPVAEPAR